MNLFLHSRGRLVSKLLLLGMVAPGLVSFAGQSVPNFLVVVGYTSGVLLLFFTVTWMASPRKAPPSRRSTIDVNMC